MSTKIIYRTSKTNKEGKHPLYIRIIKNRKTQMISLGINLSPDEWDEKKNRVKTRHPNSARLNSYISQKLADAEEATLSLLTKDKNTSASKIKEKIKGKAAGSFSDYFVQYRDRLLKNELIGTYIKTKSSISKLNQFTGNRNLQFEDIDVNFIKRYESFLENKLGNSTNTIHGSIKVIRKLYNDAVKDGIIELNQNPFLRYKLSTEKTSKVYLSETELSKIESLPLKENTRLDQNRDLFLFACYACGIRVSDLLKLKWNSFDETHLNIITQKTKEHISIPLPNKALQILRKYSLNGQDNNTFIFPLLKVNANHSAFELHRAISSSTAYLNKDLQTIAKLAEIDKHISMHTSRHTWATRALRKGMRIEYVSKLLGHASIKTTQVYAKIVNSEFDKAMKEAFDE